MQFKTAPTDIKNADSDDGTFEAFVAVFDNKDSYGDIMRKGSFADTLAEWGDKEAPIPVLWSHRTDDPDMNLGHVLEAKETDHGLWIKAQLDLDAPKAQTVHRLMKGGRVREFSFAYEVVDGSFEKDGDDKFFEVRAVKLYEVGPTPIGANPQTELLDVKARADEIVRAVKAGRVFSEKNETAIRGVIGDLRTAATSLEGVLPTEESGDEKKKVPDQTSGKEPPPDSEPVAATPNPSVSWALFNIHLEKLGETA